MSASRRRHVGLAGVVVALGCVAVARDDAAAQSARTSLIYYSAGSSFGFFTGYPDEFDAESCDQHAGGFSAWFAGPVSRTVALEASGTITTAVSGKSCASADLRVPDEGEPFTRDVFDDAIDGVSFFATNLALVIEPASGAAVSPRLRAGGGRLWDKKLWNWFYGADVRFRVGPGALVTGVERWNLGIDMQREVYIWHDVGGPELRSTVEVHRIARPWLIRVGWEGPVG